MPPPTFHPVPISLVWTAKVTFDTVTPEIAANESLRETRRVFTPVAGTNTVLSLPAPKRRTSLLRTSSRVSAYVPAETWMSPVLGHFATARLTVFTGRAASKPSFSSSPAS